MTLAERLVAIQAEYDSARAEAAYLKRLATSKARLTPAGGRDPATGDPAGEEIARLRDRADAISERASELKLQISEIENHFLETGETPDAGAAKQFRELQERLAVLRHHEHAAHKDPGNPGPIQDELKRLRAEYLHTRATELAKTYLGLAHQLVDAATQIRALGSVAQQEGSAVPLHLDHLEIPLPAQSGAGQALGPGSLCVNEQRLQETQKTLKAQLSAILNC